MIGEKSVEQIQTFNKIEAKNECLRCHKPLQNTVAHIGTPHKRGKTQSAQLNS